MASRPDPDTFPGPIVDAVATAVEAQDEVSQVVRRMLVDTDPSGLACVYSHQWQPIESSYETGGLLGARQSLEPTLGRYRLNIDYILHAQSQEQGVLESAAIAKIMRVMLYRDSDLSVSLAGLEDSTFAPSIERVKRWGIAEQRFLGEIIQGRFVYISSTTVWVETENT